MSFSLNVFFSLTMVMVYSCFSECTVRIRNTTMPPPSTVSMVRARTLGVMACGSGNEGYVEHELRHGPAIQRLTSKSCSTNMP